MTAQGKKKRGAEGHCGASVLRRNRTAAADDARVGAGGQRRRSRSEAAPFTIPLYTEFPFRYSTRPLRVCTETRRVIFRPRRGTWAEDLSSEMGVKRTSGLAARSTGEAGVGSASASLEQLRARCQFFL